MTKKNLILTMGDPAGCGPYITLKSLRDLKSKHLNFYLVGSQNLLKKIPEYAKARSCFKLIDVVIPGIEKIRPGVYSRLGGIASLTYLAVALKVMNDQKINRLVTAPLSKEAVQAADKDFSGHTEYLAKSFKVDNYAMMMVSSQIKVVLLTRHIPLKEVTRQLREKDIFNTIRLVHEALKGQFKIKQPKIALASVNPHAGLDTFLGPEERLLKVAAEKFKSSVFGPYPSDTLFIKNNLNKYDCFICPYHDQAMVPFKLLSFPGGVNVTLGLPIVRTSPAHGVAYDCMRQAKKPFHYSMVAAIKLALKLSP